MALIENIPQAMIDEHVAWHSNPGNPGAGGRAVNPWPTGGGGPSPGSGEEFLVWHHGFVDRFNAWVAGLPGAQRPPANAIAPWTEVPSMLKMGMLGWNASLASDEARLNDMSTFATLDDVGRFVEWGIHAFLHNASASMWNEPVLRSYESPRSTYFWQLHGLIDHWRQRWVDAHVAEPIVPRGNLERLLQMFLHRFPLPRPPVWPPQVSPTPNPPGPGPDPGPIALDASERALIQHLRSLRGRP